MIEAFLAALQTVGLEFFGRFYGIYKAEVVATPDGEAGLVLVKCPRVFRGQERLARPIVPMGGIHGEQSYGTFYPPEPGGMVLLVFEDGDPAEPWYIGGWFADGELPADLQADEDDERFAVRGVVTPYGLKLLYDEKGAKDDANVPVLRIETPVGAKLAIGTADDKITLETSGGAKITLEGDAATIHAPGGVTVMDGGDQAAVRGDALSTFLTTKLSVQTPFGPSGPAVTGLTAGAELSKDVKLK